MSITVQKLKIEELEAALNAMDDPEGPITDVLSLTIAPVGAVWEAVLVSREREEAPASALPDFAALAEAYAAAEAEAHAAADTKIQVEAVSQLADSE